MKIGRISLCQDYQSAYFIKTDGGFSLMETLVALSLLAIVSTLGVVVISGYIQASEAATTRLVELDQTNSLRRYISQDLQHLVARPARDTDSDMGASGTALLALASPARAVGALTFGARDQAKDQAKDQVPFLVLTRHSGDLGVIDPARSRLERVKYFLQGGQLIRRQYTRPTPTPETPFTDQILISSVAALTIEAGASGLWLDRLYVMPLADSDAAPTAPTSTASALPDMIRLTLTFTHTKAPMVHLFEIGGGYD